MAGRPKNRLELRRQYEAAEPPDPIEDEAEEVAEEVEDDDEPRPKKKVKPKARATKSAKGGKAGKPAARMRVVWIVVNDAFKTVATFPYAQKEAAEAKAAEMTARGKGTHFLQKSKEPMPDDAPGLGAAIPREKVEKPIRKAPKQVAAPAEADPVDEDEIEEEEDEEYADEDEDEDDDE